MSISPATPSLLDDDEFKPRRRGRWALALIVLILLAIFVPPFVSLNRLKGRLGSALSNSIGRQVSIGQIRLRLLPSPGFDLSDVSIQDDPAFSAEPMLHAGTVTATLRFSSLWRGRIEITSLSFQQPSVNFVRDAQGRWNVAALLKRAQQVPSAPTQKAVSESRPRFPYVEASDARINFKIGMEKKAYGFSEADLALWLAAEDEWHIRMEARPIRSDRNLHDTGTLKIEGTFQRASDPRQTPLNLILSTQNGQLGQLSEFVYGRDGGWRGGLDANATISGTPADLRLTFEAAVDDFRRYDITGSDSARIRARCTARYGDTAEEPQSLHDIGCRVPAGNGEISTRGSVLNIFRAPRYDLSVAVSDLPGTVLASAMRRMKKGVIADLNASGEMNGAFTVRSSSDDGTPIVAGGGSLHNVRISSRMIQPELVVGDVQLSLDRDDAKPGKRSRKRGPQDAAAPPAPTLRVSSTQVVLGATPPRVAYLEATIHPGDFSISMRGQAALERALPIAQALGFSVPKPTMTGVADINMVLNGIGRDFAEPWFEGKASLTGVKVRGAGVPAPVSMDYSTAEFSRDRTDFWTQEAVIGDGKVRVHGTLSFPRECNTSTCPVRFALASDQIHLDDINSLLSSGTRDRPWYSFGKRADANGLAALSAQGTLNVARLIVKSASFDRFSAFVHFEDGKLDLTNITTDMGAGKHIGELHATFTGEVPQYDLAGTVSNASLEAVGTSVWSTAWRGSPAHGGTLEGKYRLHLSGWDAPALFKSADGSADLVWNNGAFTGHADNGTARTLEVKEFSDHVAWRDGALQIPPADLKTAAGTFEISGSFARCYDLRVQSNKKPLLVAFGTMASVSAVTAKK